MDKIQDLNLSGEDFLRVSNLARSFWEKGSTEETPEFVIFTGGVGSGKTTLRRERYAKDFVHFEGGEILVALEKIFGKDNPEAMAKIAQLTCELILTETFKSRLNLVTEIIGDDEFSLMALIEGMRAAGYKVQICPVILDPKEAYARHLKAVEEDPDYYSAYFMQEATISSILSTLNKVRSI